MFDNQIAMQLSAGKGLGLADMLIRQLGEGSRPEAQGSGQNDAGTGVASRLPGLSSADSGASLKPRASSLAASKADFVRTFLPHAQKAAREIGVDPHALLAQAALETGWGRSVPCNARGDCSFNLFGIKAGSHWSGATVSVPTLEFEQGIPVRRFERFRSYDSAADSFRDYAQVIRNSSRYENALGAGDDVASFAAALQQGGYATDPAYAQKIIAVADEVRSLSAGPLKMSAALPINPTRGG
jgi:flagellar protein FlgJ